MKTILISPEAKQKSIQDDIAARIWRDLMKQWKPSYFAPPVSIRQREKDGTLNGTELLMTGLDNYQACEKLGIEANRIVLDDAEEFKSFTLAARIIGNLRLTEAELVLLALDAKRLTRHQYTREMQSQAGGDRRSAAAVAERVQKAGSEAANRFFSAGEKAIGDGMRSEEIAHRLVPQVEIPTIRRASKIEKDCPEVFQRWRGGEFKTFAEVRGAFTEQVRTKKRNTEQREIERVRRVALAGVTLIHGDNARVLSRWTHQPPTLIFADPPFNNGWKYDSDPSGDKLPDAVYLEGLKRTFQQCREILAPNGTVCICTPARQAGPIDWMMRRALGFDWRTTIYWWNHFPNNMPAAYPEAVKQILIYARTPQARPIFHPRFVESRRNALGDARGATMGKVPDNVWPILMLPGNATARSGFTDAAPEQPFEVPFRCILAHTEPGDLVLDPFNGNGTTGRAAVVAGRRYCGIDRSQRYLDLSRIGIEDAAINGPPETIKDRMMMILRDQPPAADAFEREMTAGKKGCH